MAKIKGSWLLDEDFTFPDTDIRQAVNFTTNQTLTNSDGVSSNTFCRMQIGRASSTQVSFDYWPVGTTDVSFFIVHHSGWKIPEYDRIVHFGDTEQEVDDVFWLCFTANAKNLSSGEDEPDTPEPDDPDTPEVDTPSPDTVRGKIRNLIAKANVTTGGSYTDLTKAVKGLCAGYGEGGIKGISTATEMTSLLTTAEVGSVVKYMGETTDTYEYGGLYIVEAVSE